MSSNFQPGDPVVRTGPSIDGLIKGDVYTVSEHLHNTLRLENEPMAYDPARFVKVAPHNAPIEDGDLIVRISSGQDVVKGELYTAANVVGRELGVEEATDPQHANPYLAHYFRKVVTEEMELVDPADDLAEGDPVTVWLDDDGSGLVDGPGAGGTFPQRFVGKRLEVYEHQPEAEDEIAVFNRGRSLWAIAKRSHVLPLPAQPEPEPEPEPRSVDLDLLVAFNLSQDLGDPCTGGVAEFVAGAIRNELQGRLDNYSTYDDEDHISIEGWSVRVKDVREIINSLTVTN